MSAYDYSIQARKSAEVPLADLLSRQPSGKINCEINAFFESPVPWLKRQVLQKMASNDKYKTLKQYIREGWPRSFDSRLKAFYQFRQELTVEDEMIYRRSQLIIPDSLQAPILQELHRTHMGIQKTKEFARQFYFWPGMSKIPLEVVNSV